MLQLRDYQEEALAALFAFWERGGENGLIELATGTGKSLVQAELFKRLTTDYEGLRILALCHVKELLSQNISELFGIWPFAPAGIYSAGMGRRELHAQIVFGGIQSIYTKARQLGHVDLVAIDECHLLSSNSESMYGQLLGDLAKINPDMRCVGLTATSFRTDSGSLVSGDVRLFDEIVFKYGIKDGIEDGYLSPLVSKATVTGFDLSGVARRGGDFVPGALNAACDKEATTKAAVDEIVAKGQDRKSWLAFCSGVEHAHHVAEEIRRRGISCGVVTGSTPSGERAKLIEDHKSGKIRCLTNNSVLTTGYNNPAVDLLAMLRPTLSAGLYVQMAGRGTRLAKGKDNCLVLDFAGNVARHGPVDCVVPKEPGDKTGEALIKECPQCHSLVHLSYRECPDCGFTFVTEEKPKHEAKAAALPILSTTAPEWLPVQSRKLFFHDKIGGQPSVRAEFMCSFQPYKHWICPGHQGFAKSKSDKWWKQHGGELPCPDNVDDFLERVGELRDTTEIQARRQGKYWEIVGFKVDPVAKQQVAGVANYKPHVRGPALDLDDSIPF